MKKQDQKQPEDDIDRIGRIFEKFANRYHWDYSQIFTDVLDAMLHLATVGAEFAQEYAQSVERYGKEPLHDLIYTITECSANFNDALGTIYEYIVITKGKSAALGQFFTPQHVTRLMAQIAYRADLKGRRQNINDPCVGSGRTLLAMGDIYGDDRWRHMFWATDVDVVSVKMSTINLWLNSMPAIIIHGNSLELSLWNACEVILNWQHDPQAQGGGRWTPFVARLSDQQQEALREIIKLPSGQLNKAIDIINDERLLNLQKHRARGGIKLPKESPLLAPTPSLIAPTPAPPTARATTNTKPPKPSDQQQLF